MTFVLSEQMGGRAMLKKSIAFAAVAMASMSPALAAKELRTPRPTGACAQSTGCCIAACDQLNWCQMYICTGGRSKPVPFWRCYEPSGLCFAPRC
jgi:hypothetical protein